MAKNKVKHKKLKNRVKILIFFIIVVITFIIFFKWIDINLNSNLNVGDDEVFNEIDVKECMIDNYNTVINDAEIMNKENELTAYFSSNYNMSLYYKDINLGYNYIYNSDQQYYAASTIKMLDAIYIYDKAINGDLNLEDTVTYERKHHLGASFEMQNYNYGDKVSLRNLVNYAVSVSDNTAHKMLIDYIGKLNLRSYGLNLGAKLTLLGDDFGTIDVNDSMVYLDKLYELISLDNDLARELAGYFINSDQNYLTINGFKALQKYGEYDFYYHSNGIVLTDNPYEISILTLHGKDNFEKVIKDINAKVFELHELFYKKMNDLCYN